jgi:cytochrome b6-f complex subunit 4
MKTLEKSTLERQEQKTRSDRDTRDCYKSELEWRNELFYIFPLVSLGTIAVCIGYAILNPIAMGEAANPFATPQDLLPEWYLYPVYQLVRIFPHKELGIVLVGLVSLGLLLIPFIENADRLHYKMRRMVSVTIFFLSAVVTLWLGLGATHPIEQAFTLGLF